MFWQATDDGKTLIIVNMASGELYTVDPQSGEAAQIDLGGVLVQGGDGLVRISLGYGPYGPEPFALRFVSCESTASITCSP